MKGYNIITPINNEYYLDSVNNIGKIQYYPTFLKEKKAEKLYNVLKNESNWKHGIYKMFGKDIKTPRLLWAMKNPKTDITDSYTVTDSSIWSTLVKKIKTKVEKLIGKKIKYAQLNYYRDGSDYIGWHTDSEIKSGHIIASLSIGQPRLFQFKGIKTDDKHQIILENGSLIIFDEDAGKKLWKHRIPKQTKIRQGRINLTFRLE
tara:strand:+ start:476 stop:1087 length:612 start_codon:yes stop_codon:yes gene_type:complete